MKIRLELILTASIVHFGLTSVIRYNRMADQGVARGVPMSDEIEIRESVKNLFNSMAKNDIKKSQTYHEVLKQEASKERSTFDTMKEELRTVRNKNAQRRNSYKNIDVGEKNIQFVKRETTKNNRNTGQKRHKKGQNSESSEESLTWQKSNEAKKNSKSSEESLTGPKSSEAKAKQNRGSQKRRKKGQNSESSEESLTWPKSKEAKKNSKSSEESLTWPKSSETKAKQNRGGQKHRKKGQKSENSEGLVRKESSKAKQYSEGRKYGEKGQKRGRNDDEVLLWKESEAHNSESDENVAWKERGRVQKNSMERAWNETIKASNESESSEESLTWPKSGEVKRLNETRANKTKDSGEILCPYTGGEAGQEQDDNAENATKSEFADWEFYYDKDSTDSTDDTAANATTLGGLTFLDMGPSPVTPPYDTEDMTARNDDSLEDDPEWMQSEWRQNWTRKTSEERFEEALQHAKRDLLVNWYRHGLEQWKDLEKMKRHRAKDEVNHHALSEPIEVVELRLNKALRTIAKYIAKFDYGEATGEKTMW